MPAEGGETALRRQKSGDEEPRSPDAGGAPPRREILGRFVASPLQLTFGWAATGMMGFASRAMLVSTILG
jgi:hypothetical protein